MAMKPIVKPIVLAAIVFYGAPLAAQDVTVSFHGTLTYVE